MEDVEYPINGELDLHHFKPGEVNDLVPEYIQACIEREIFQIRIVHGKGRGVLRKTVHSILDKSAAVESYWHESGAGSWGATVVKLIKA